MHNLEIPTCAPLKYKMDDPILYQSISTERVISEKKWTRVFPSSC